jgi:hypothetical protein
MRADIGIAVIVVDDSTAAGRVLNTERIQTPVIICWHACCSTYVSSLAASVVGDDDIMLTPRSSSSSSRARRRVGFLACGLRHEWQLLVRQWRWRS